MGQTTAISVIAAALLLTACGAAGGEGPSQTEEVATAVTGRIVHRSDTPDVPNVPWDSGLALVVPASATGDFWTALGQPSQGPSRQSHLEVVVERTALPPAVEAVSIGPDGAFESGAIAEAALICLSDEAAGDPDGYRIRGCADVAAAGTGSLTLSFGLGGLMVDAVPGR